MAKQTNTEKSEVIVEQARPETVTIPASSWERVLEEIESLKKSNSMLMEVADKKSVANWYQRNSGETPKIIRVRKLGDKIVTSWRTTIDHVYQDPQTRVYKEIQKTNITFVDNTEVEYTLSDFNRSFDYVECEVLKETVEKKTGETIYTVRSMEDGATLDISAVFIN